MALLPSLPTNQKTVTYPAALTPNFAYKNYPQDFSGGAMGKNLPASAGDTASISGPGRFHLPQSAGSQCEESRP